MCLLIYLTSPCQYLTSNGDYVISVTEDVERNCSDWTHRKCHCSHWKAQSIYPLSISVPAGCQWGLLQTLSVRQVTRAVTVKFPLDVYAWISTQSILRITAVILHSVGVLPLADVNNTYFSNKLLLIYKKFSRIVLLPSGNSLEFSRIGRVTTRLKP